MARFSFSGAPFRALWEPLGRLVAHLGCQVARSGVPGGPHCFQSLVWIALVPKRCIYVALVMVLMLFLPCICHLSVPIHISFCSLGVLGIGPLPCFLQFAYLSLLAFTISGEDPSTPFAWAGRALGIVLLVCHSALGACIPSLVFGSASCL